MDAGALLGDIYAAQSDAACVMGIRPEVGTYSSLIFFADRQCA
jgi:hypothetical protein